MARTKDEALKLSLGPLSFNCSAGCGACGVKLQDFVTHKTQAQEGDEWVVVATQPQIVSTCCGSPVEVWDERKQDITASIDATPPAAQPALEPLTFDEWYSNAIWGNEDFKEGCRRAWNASRGQDDHD